MSICFLETPAAEETYLTNKLPNEDLEFLEHPLNDQAKLSNGPVITVISPFVHSQIGRNVIDRLPNLKLIATRSTGYDHIDIRYATQRGIAVANVPTYGENTVAEHTFALILALSRNVHKASARTFAGDFSLDGLQGFDRQDDWGGRHRSYRPFRR